jgi:hypothetical protein
MDEPLVHPLLIEQHRRNLATRDAWQRFAPHRQRVTDLLIAAIPAAVPAPTLAVFGAGNCNDLDLVKLRGQFSQIHLLDCDCESLRQGIERQGLTADPGICPLGPLDLSGIAQLTSAGSPSRPLKDNEIDAALAAAATISAGQPCDVVASVCLISQILEGLALALGPEHLRYLELVQRLRHNHFRLLIEHLKSGGTGLLITDVVSSDTAPQIIGAQPLALPVLVRELIQQGNFFTGLNPAVIHALLVTDPLLACRVADVTILAPWTWDLGSRVYVAYAVRFRCLPGELAGSN